MTIDKEKLKPVIEYILKQEAQGSLGSGDEYDAAYSIYDAEVTPAAVLALIAENEALKGPHDWLAEDLIKELVDNAQSFQENACEEGDDPFVIVLLAAASRIRRQEANIAKFKAENEQLAKTADCWDRLNIQNKALSDSFRAERDQLKAELATERQRRWDGNEIAARERDEEVRKLKAEVAGLRTGYEAYEQVNAELKAENETLIAAAQALRDEWRKDQADAKRYRFLRNEASSRVQDYCIVKKFWGGTFPDRILVLDGADAEIDAALGQGERS